MRKEKFINYCQAVDSGSQRFVENLQTHEKGRVVSCKEDSFEVDVAGSVKVWKSNQCAETSSTETSL